MLWLAVEPQQGNRGGEPVAAGCGGGRNWAGESGAEFMRSVSSSSIHTCKVHW